MSSGSELRASENPRKWQFTWESQSHIPTLKLYLFNPNTKPSTQCANLKVNLVLGQSLLKVSWFEAELEISLRFPIPKVLVDFESPAQFKALDDNIEVKLALLLSVDHQIASTLGSVLDLSEEDYESGSEKALSDELQPLLMDFDLESLSSTGGVHFYCKSCSVKLTRSLRVFEDMPSVNWREVADNWFDACCCSFGGISEKLVTRYAKSYTSTTGLCLLNNTTVVLCKDDLVGFTIPHWEGSQKEESKVDFTGVNCLNKANTNNHEKPASFDCQNNSMHDCNRKLSGVCPTEDDLASKVEHEEIEELINSSSLYHASQTLGNEENKIPSPGCHVDTKTIVLGHDFSCCTPKASETSLNKQEYKNVELLENQKSFLNGFLGNVFMTRSSNLSKDVRWIELLCPRCSCMLGAYPCGNGEAALDSGVHFFKCYISTSSQTGGSSNLFRKYTLEKMFTNQLLESAKDELSFRTVVRDMQTKCPMLQIVLFNPNSWCCAGYCLGTGEPVPKIDMYPVIKLLFSDCSKSSECQLRMIEEWVKKNQADEVFMLSSQIKELTESLESANNLLPPSHTLLQGFSLSSMRR